MYFKVDRKILKKALILLKEKQQKAGARITVTNGLIEGGEYFGILGGYISQIEFALYKTKMNDFYIDYDFAQEIRPTLLTKKEIKK